MKVDPQRQGCARGVNQHIPWRRVTPRRERLMEFIRRRVQDSQPQSRKITPALAQRGFWAKGRVQAARVRQRQQAISKCMSAFFDQPIGPIEIGHFIGWNGGKHKNDRHEQRGRQPAAQKFSQWHLSFPAPV